MTSNTYFAEDVAALVAAQNPGTPGFDANGYEIVRQVSQNLDNKDTGYTIKLDWKPTDSSLVYLSTSKGFKGSALDIRPVYALVPVANVVSGLEETRLEPESLDVWEIGYKGNFWDNRIQLDAAAFIYSYENLQAFVTARGIPTLDNALESEITGFDANVQYGSDNGFYMQAGVSLLDTEVTDAGASTPSFYIHLMLKSFLTIIQQSIKKVNHEEKIYCQFVSTRASRFNRPRS